MHKRIYILVLFLLIGTSVFAQERPDRRARIIVDNDLCGDPDGLVALAQQVLCNTVNLRGIVGAHLNAGPMVSGNQADASVQKAQELLTVMGLSGRFTIVPGAAVPMSDSGKPIDSEGAQLIIREARACTPEQPLYLLMGGPLTDAASALLLAPDIAPNIILVWIGGQEYPFGHPQPWTGISEVEYNLNLSIPSARYIFNDSPVRLWQIPRDAYRQCLYSFASWDRHIAPLGALGKYLDDAVCRWRDLGIGQEVYALGDSPLVLLSSMQTFFERDTASSDFVETAAPHITESGSYDFSRPGRIVRVYTRIDTALMFKDMEDRLALHAIRNN